jgi:hypothetical protein
MDEIRTTYGDRVKEAISLNVEKTIKFPKPVFQKFDAWAKANANDCYWLAIEKLVMEYDKRVEYEDNFRVLIERDDFLISQIKELQDRLAVLETKPKETFKTFGRKE